jgi:hypothetical protein
LSITLLVLPIVEEFVSINNRNAFQPFTVDCGPQSIEAERECCPDLAGYRNFDYALKICGDESSRLAEFTCQSLVAAACRQDQSCIVWNR